MPFFTEPHQQKPLGILLFAIQLTFIVLFGVFGKYEANAHAKHHAEDENDFHPLYPMFQDVHIMIFIGFGFLMTFLKRYGYSAVGFNMLLAAIAIQWSIIIQGLIESEGKGFELHITSMVKGDFAAATVLITYGVLLGKTTPFQLTVLTLIEVTIYAANVYVGEGLFKASDAGGSMLIHSFGAYFGLACSLVLKRKWYDTHKDNAPVYHSDLFAMIGTLFLWICWPSFNGALLTDADQQHRTAINTYLSLAACVLVSFGTSVLVSHKSKLDMVHVQNATLAGGVAIGTMANFMINPYGAMIMGSLAGIISVLGYQFLTPFLAKKLGLHDTCGVHNLHGMPGVMAGIAGIVAAYLATPDVYGEAGVGQVFHARANVTTGDHLMSPRSAAQQAGYQAACLGVTLGLAIVGGALTGLLLRLKVFSQVNEYHGFSDETFWEVPEEEEERKERVMVVQDVLEEKLPLTTTVELIEKPGLQ